MRKRIRLPSLAWALLGLLVLAAAVLSLGRRETSVNPSIASYGPSGSAAFAELLRQSGFDVRGDMSTMPRLSEIDLAIAFFLVGEVSAGPLPELPSLTPRLRSHVERGGSLILLPLLPNIDEAGAADRATAVETISGREFSVLAGSDLAWALNIQPDEEAPVFAVWTLPQREPLAVMYKIGRGRVLAFGNGFFVSNRRLDKESHAEIALRSVAMMAPEKGRIVFTEASAGNATAPSIVEVLGPWAMAAWYQTLFLFAVIVYTLGKRFGLPDVGRRPQRGSRELADAIATTLQRSRAARSALELVARQCDARLRQALRISRDAPRAELDRMLPAELREASARVEAALSMKKVPPRIACELGAALEEEAGRVIGKSIAPVHSMRGRG